MWWIALVACQDRAVEVVGRLAHIDRNVTHRAPAAVLDAAPAEPAPVEAPKPILYEPVSHPVESSSAGTRFEGVTGKRRGAEEVYPD